MDKQEEILKEHKGIIKLNDIVKKVAKEQGFNKLFFRIFKSELEENTTEALHIIISNMGNFELRKDYNLKDKDINEILDCAYDDMVYELIHFLASRNRRFDSNFMEIN